MIYGVFYPAAAQNYLNQIDEIEKKYLNSNHAGDKEDDQAKKIRSQSKKELRGDGISAQWRSEIKDVNAHISKMTELAKKTFLTEPRNNRTNSITYKIWTYETLMAYKILMDNVKTNIINNLRDYKLNGDYSVATEYLNGECVAVDIPYENDEIKNKIIQYVNDLYDAQLQNADVSNPTALLVSANDYDSARINMYRVITACRVNELGKKIQLNAIYFPYATTKYTFSMRYLIFAPSLITKDKMFSSYDAEFSFKQRDIFSPNVKLFIRNIEKIEEGFTANSYIPRYRREYIDDLIKKIYIIGLCCDVQATQTDLIIISDFDYLLELASFFEPLHTKISSAEELEMKNYLRYDCFVVSGKYTV